MTNYSETRTWINKVTTNIKEDLILAMNPDSPYGGYWSTLLLIFCYCDFLGMIFSGKGPESKNAVHFIKKYFGKRNSRYQDIGGLVYTVFRHGLVHSTRPKKCLIKNKKYFYVIGKKSDIVPNSNNLTFIWKKRDDGDDKTYSHLTPAFPDPTNPKALEDPGIKVFPISLPKLHEDFIAAMDSYLADLDTYSNLQNNAIKIFQLIQSPTEFFIESNRVKEKNLVDGKYTRNYIDIHEIDRFDPLG